MKISFGAFVMMTLVIVQNAVQTAHLFVLSGQSNMARQDPDISFRPTLVSALGSDEVYIADYALGQQNLAQWIKNNKPGPLYGALMNEVLRVSFNRSIESITFVWAHGESNALNAQVFKNYQKDLIGLVRKLATDLRCKNMSVVVTRITDCCLYNPYWRKMRELQASLIINRNKIPWVNMDDLKDSINGIHLTPEGYVKLGGRLANESLLTLRPC